MTSNSTSGGPVGSAAEEDGTDWLGRTSKDSGGGVQFGQNFQKIAHTLDTHVCVPRRAVSHKKEATLSRQKSRKIYRSVEDVVGSECSWAVSAYCNATRGAQLSALEDTTAEHKALPAWTMMARCTGGALAKHDIMVKHLQAAGAGSVGAMQEVIDGGPSEETIKERKEQGILGKTPGTRYWAGQIDDHYKMRKGVDTNPKLNVQMQLDKCLKRLQDTELFTTNMQQPAMDPSKKVELDEVWEQCIWKWYKKPMSTTIENHL
ncbi:unnamed protein product [Amoebophrya sp. A120]|nr:unnamed protein product [Amoebophrya sp. A120]|eukprot:GSA120T00000976001.1